MSFKDRMPDGASSMPALPGWQAGFSLVELMISMTISLVILAALVAVFVNTSGSSNEMARANGLIENGRLAIQVLENDIVHGGFWGTAVPQFDNQTSGGIPADVPGAVPDPCLVYNPGNWTDAYKTDLVGIPVQANDTASFCTGIVTDKRDDSDVLVVRHAETCVAGSGGNCEADIAGKLYFQPSRCLTDLTFYTLDTAGFTLLQRDCATVAEKRKFVSDLYYIRDYAVTAGDGIPTLMRSQFDLTPGAGGKLEHQGAVAMIEGIESLVVEFGIDDVSKTGEALDYTAAINWDDPGTRTTPTNRGDGAPDGDFIRCTTGSPCTAAQLMNVTAVKLYVLARSRELTRGYTDTKTYTLGSGPTLGPFNDSFKRHLFVTTVRLPNVSGRRMTP